MSAQAAPPRIAVTMGDPAGIGPEIIAKLLTQQDAARDARLLVLGDARVMREAVTLVGSALRVRTINAPAEAAYEPGALDVLETSASEAGDMPCGALSAQAGRAAYAAVERAVQLALDGHVDATVTAPLNKEALRMAGISDAGHTEIYARLTGAAGKAVMMLAEGNLRVAHVSTHVSLRQACDLATCARIAHTIRCAHDALISFGIAAPRIAVAGLNPHAGESGLFGREEALEIQPAISLAQAEGMNVRGPIPPDVVFFQALGGAYDAVIAMYHDQGHIPVKTVGFAADAQGNVRAVRGVNITLGVPVIRVSVDHGTAFDRAWRGVAQAGSLAEAVRWAARLARGRKNNALDAGR